jgi:hypothetical protein
MNEIQAIQEALKCYQYPANEREFELAEAYMLKVHAKYGTVNVAIIKELLN